MPDTPSSVLDQDWDTLGPEDPVNSKQQEQVSKGEADPAKSAAVAQRAAELWTQAQESEDSKVTTLSKSYDGKPIVGTQGPETQRATPVKVVDRYRDEEGKLVTMGFSLVDAVGIPPAGRPEEALQAPPSILEVWAVEQTDTEDPAVTDAEMVGYMVTPTGASQHNTAPGLYLADAKSQSETQHRTTSMLIQGATPVELFGQLNPGTEEFAQTDHLLTGAPAAGTPAK